MIHDIGYAHIGDTEPRYSNVPVIETKPPSSVKLDKDLPDYTYVRTVGYMKIHDDRSVIVLKQKSKNPTFREDCIFLMKSGRQKLSDYSDEDLKALSEAFKIPLYELRELSVAERNFRHILNSVEQ